MKLRGEGIGDAAVEHLRDEPALRDVDPVQRQAGLDERVDISSTRERENPIVCFEPAKNPP
jgi:hypothetical protein